MTKRTTSTETGLVPARGLSNLDGPEMHEWAAELVDRARSEGVDLTGVVGVWEGDHHVGFRARVGVAKGEGSGLRIYGASSLTIGEPRSYNTRPAGDDLGSSASASSCSGCCDAKKGA